ncbi:von Willebrand factor type A domain-containing protein, partial [Oligoflexia bacterium]|nr:von Willebrand factor type A domain-containing protein [Oligoflexia bacterium]
SAVATVAVLVVVVKLAIDTPESFMTKHAAIEAFEELEQKDRLKSSKQLEERNEAFSISVPEAQTEPSGPVVAGELSKRDTATESPAIGLPITSGNKAVDIKIEHRSSAEGQPVPGDRVDVVVTHKDKDSGQVKSKVISENIRLKGIADAPGSAGRRQRQVTLDAPEMDASKINAAKKIGTLSLSKRSMDEAKVVGPSEISTYDIGRSAGKGSQATTGRVRIQGQEYVIDQNGSMRGVVVPQAMAEKEEAVALGDSVAANVQRPNQIADPRDAFSQPSAFRAPGLIAAPPAQPQDRERYGAWRENERTLVAAEAISTFSIDVDTGSYTNARRFLSAGTLPPKDSVRIEEFINYFDYSYPVQSAKPFTLSYEMAPAPLEPQRYLLKLGIKARAAGDSEKPWNLVFLVDVSGSMSSANKLMLVQRALKLLTNRMRPGDKVAIVTYAGYAGVALESTSIREKQKILSAIDRLSSGGSTHGSAGVERAYAIAQQNRIAGGVNRVILATDGDFNVGVTSNAALLNLIEAKRKQGITLTTLGFGTGNFNEAMMEQLANKGNGNYFYIDSFKEARKVFETDLAGTIEVVAKDVKLQIEFNPAHIAEYRLIGYENRKLRKQDFNNDLIDAGEIGAGHTVTALYEVVLADSDLANNLKTEYRYQKLAAEKKLKPTKAHGSELAFLKIRFKQPEGTKSALLQYPIERKHVRASADKASDDFRFAAAVSYAGHLLRGSQYAGRYTFRDVITLASGAKGSDPHGYRREFIELIKNAASVSE